VISPALETGPDFIMKLQIIKPFDWAHRGVEIVAYTPGEIDTTDEDLIRVAIDQGWAVRETSAHFSAPETSAMHAEPDRPKRGRKPKQPDPA
jgi:hypothetical protein